MIEKANKLGGKAEVPTDLRAKIELRMKETPATTWDAIVREIAEDDVEDDEVRPDAR